jgi:hypothetical protein
MIEGAGPVGADAPDVRRRKGGGALFRTVDSTWQGLPVASWIVISDIISWLRCAGNGVEKR